MKVSIITVAYNSGKTISDTLQSVANQEGAEIEHLIIDGGSKDDTIEKVRLEGAHVAHLISERDEGIYHAMNKGLALATGEWVGFLNADDMLATPTAIGSLMDATAGGADVVYADLDYVRNQDIEKIVRRWRSGPYTPAALRQGWMPPHPTFYFRREKLGHFRFDTSYRIAADYDFMLRILLQSDIRVAYLAATFVKMRTGGASNSSLGALWRKSMEDLRVMRQHKLGGMSTLVAKNLSKLPQFIQTRSRTVI
jgi:glycosyltransferase